MTGGTDENDSEKGGHDIENVGRLCPYCFTPYKGEDGVLTHLRQMADQMGHPADAAEIQSEEAFPQVEIDGRGNVIWVIDDRGDVDADTDAAIPASRVYHLIAQLLAENETEMAVRLRHHLLGIDEYVPPHQALYEALLAQLYTDDPDEQVQAALTPEGITIAARGESACCTAIEVRDLCDGLEAARREAELEGKMETFIKFLRYAADVLEEGEVEDFPVKFRDWQDS